MKKFILIIFFLPFLLSSCLLLVDQPYHRSVKTSHRVHHPVKYHTSTRHYKTPVYNNTRYPAKPHYTPRRVIPNNTPRRTSSRQVPQRRDSTRQNRPTNTSSPRRSEPRREETRDSRGNQPSANSPRSRIQESLRNAF